MGDMCGFVTFRVESFLVRVVAGDNINQIVNKRTIVCVEAGLGEWQLVSGGGLEGGGGCCPQRMV